MSAPERSDDAISRLRAALRPGDAQAQFALANALWPAGQRDQAVAAYTQAVADDPGFVDARNNLGNALCGLGRFADALAQYEAALALRPNSAELHYNCGNALAATDRLSEAETRFHAAIALDPGHAGAHNNLGNALRAQGRHEAAIESYRAALTLRPAYYGTINNIGSALLALHRPQEAEDCFRRTLAQQPDYAEACNNLGGALLAQDRPQEALIWFRRAYTLDPGQVQAQFGEALALLVQGEFEAGWRAYEARWRDPRFCEDEPAFAAPLWRGDSDPAGQRILLHAEQGLGDSIQFVRYAPLLRGRGATVILSVQPSLVTLFAGLAESVIAAGEPPPPHDRHCPLLSLPLAFRTTLEDIPATGPYLHATAAATTDWRHRLGPPRGLRVGVAWSGSPDHPDDAIRSIPAARLLPPLLATGADLHAAQRDIAEADQPAAATIRVHSPALAHFAATAGLLANLDLVIAVDTSVAHLAAAMGLPTWILLQTSNDFRWLRARGDSPWYPTVRLFRQPAPGDWDTVITAVAAALAQEVSARAS